MRTLAKLNLLQHTKDFLSVVRIFIPILAIKQLIGLKALICNIWNNNRQYHFKSGLQTQCELKNTSLYTPCHVCIELLKIKNA